MSSRGAKAQKQTGLSLIEVLVAFTVMAIGLGGIYQVVGAGLKAAQRGDEYSRALLVARTQLARVGIDTSPDLGRSSGTVDEVFRWVADVTPYLPGTEELDFTEAVVDAVEVRLEVSWGNASEERGVVLNTVRLKVPAP
jgi:general secretion pathway protein I